MKLFAIYVGGEHPKANIEIHDMRFVAAPSLEASYDELRRQWWGTPGTLHVDCWAELDHADGYDIELRSDPFAGPERLYYVNLGGYDTADFSEQHKNVFVVAPTLAGAKTRAIRSVRGWDALHRDDIYEADQAFALDDAVADRRLHIHLTPSALARPLTFSCDYRPIRAKS